MKLNISFLAILYCLLSITVSAQETKAIPLQVNVQYQGEKVILDEARYTYKEKPLTLSQFKCYLSQFELLHKGKVVWQEKDSYHLLDVEKPSSLLLALQIPPKLKYDELRMQVGTDSLTNVSGAMGGDLDPTKGMYWAWNTGYINFKLEGISEYCPTRKNKFEFHLGGYMSPYQTVQVLSFPVKKGNALEMTIELSRFLERLDLREAHSVMIPGEEAARLAKRAVGIFDLE